jgi:hypothetical protein
MPRHEGKERILIRVRNLLGVLATAALPFGAVVLSAPGAHASDFDCVLADGCGTFHSVNAAGYPVAMDAKYQDGLEEIIGYPDLSGDKATDFALVAHDQAGQRVRYDKTYAVTGSADGLTATVSDGELVFSLNVASISGYAGFTYAAGLSGVAGVPASVSLAATSTPGVYTGQVRLPFSLASGTYTLDATVAAAVIPPNTAEVPVFTAGSFTLTVTAAEVTTVAHSVEYSIVYAPDDRWTSDCVTVTGAGLLRGTPCTAGRNPAQLFALYAAGTSTPLAVSDVAVSQEYNLKSLVTGRYVEDQSVSAPSVPQTDAADAILPGGRDVDANGIDATAADAEWYWGS